jgi:hypothetical protein
MPEHLGPQLAEQFHRHRTSDVATQRAGEGGDLVPGGVGRPFAAGRSGRPMPPAGTRPRFGGYLRTVPSEATSIQVVVRSTPPAAVRGPPDQAVGHAVDPSIRNPRILRHGPGHRSVSTQMKSPVAIPDARSAEPRSTHGTRSRSGPKARGARPGRRDEAPPSQGHRRRSGRRDRLLRSPTLRQTSAQAAAPRLRLAPLSPRRPGHTRPRGSPGPGNKEVGVAR